MKLLPIYKGLIKERALYDISLKDFNLNGIAQNWLMSSPETVINNFKYEMQDDYGLSGEAKEEIMDAEDDEILDSERFKKWLKYEVEYKIEDAIDTLSGYIDNGIITMWRDMTVDDAWLKNLGTTGQRLGRYWSYERDAAEAHWGGKESNNIKIQISVNSEYIDWDQTIEANIDPNTGEDEKEITLFKNTPINITALWVNDEEKDISKIKNKTFKA